MSYDTSKFTKLGHLKTLSQRTKAISDRVTTIENAGYIPESTIDSKISAAISGALIPGGSVTFANLPALAKANCNHIYNVEDAFTTTADFKEGADVDYPAGTNVAIINIGTDESPVYKYDAYTGTFDFSGFATKQTSAVTGNFASFDATGNVQDSGSKAADFATAGHTHSDKADKVTGATENDLAKLDADGNLADSGIPAANVQQKLTGATAGNVLTADANGFMQDSNTALSSLLVGSAATDEEVAEMLAEVFDDEEESGT